MATKFSLKRTGDLNRFYTRSSVGSLLIEALGPMRPDRILDLGSGSGALSAAAAQKWPSATFVTVDLDPTIADCMQSAIADTGAKDHHHYKHDALDESLPNALRKHSLFDLAVCNPPFFKPAWKTAFARILANGALANIAGSSPDVTAEMLFLAQNIRLLKDGGIVAMIAPDGLLTNWRFHSFRQTLLGAHEVRTVVQLPANSFHDTDARCFILIAKKGCGPTKEVILQQYNPQDESLTALKIDRAAAELRLDFDFHLRRAAATGSHTSLREMKADIRRGSLDTISRKTAVHFVFHTTDFNAQPDGLINFAGHAAAKLEERMVTAEPGDILMARVDRNLHEKVGLVVSGSFPITDCVYRIRVEAEHQQRVFAFLRSDNGRAVIKSYTKGVGARLLSKKDLLDLAFG